MAKGKPGADSSVLVTNRIGDRGLIELATALYGEAPVFWGRYFTSASSGGSVEYRHLKENQPLRDNNIRVLPIARQTNRVSGTHSDGSADGHNWGMGAIASDYVAKEQSIGPIYDYEGGNPLEARS